MFPKCYFQNILAHGNQVNSDMLACLRAVLSASEIRRSGASVLLAVVPRIAENTDTSSEITFYPCLAGGR
jgi:hypothetical protein